MIDVNELRKGVTFELDEALYKVLDYHHNKTGRGKATIRIKAQNLFTGTILEKSFISGDRVQNVRLEYRNLQYLYNDGDLYYFMDLETFEQPAISKKIIGDPVNYLKEEMEVKATYYNGKPIDVELPTSVDLLVTSAETVIRGDTATGVSKRVKVESGATVSVPYFIDEGDMIRVDTRNGEYITRANE